MRRTHRRFLILFLVGLLACGLLPTPSPTPLPSAVPVTPTVTPPPEAPLGSSGHPLILALAPSPQRDPNALNAGKTLQAQLEKRSGLRLSLVAPTSERELVEALKSGSVHLAVLSPFAYLEVSDSGAAEAAFGRQREEKVFYGAQFIVRSDAGFIPYFDPLKGENTAEASVALAQFADKKPCWSDPLSPSGYVVPLGYLRLAGLSTREAAFVSGQPTVVRAVYARGICDFGATYIDARAYPGLEDEFPDVMKKVVVVWRIPPIIPYETMVFARGMSVEMRRALRRAFVELLSTPEGRSAMQTVYGMDAMQVTQDGQYEEFRKAVRASGLDLHSLFR